MCYSNALTRHGKPIPAPLFNDVPDLLLRVIVAFDSIQIAGSTQLDDRINRCADLISKLGKALDYDRSCAGQVDWTPDHEAGNSIWTAWMRCVLNQAVYGSDFWTELESAIDAARVIVKPT